MNALLLQTNMLPYAFFILGGLLFAVFGMLLLRYKKHKKAFKTRYAHKQYSGIEIETMLQRINDLPEGDEKLDLQKLKAQQRKLLKRWIFCLVVMGIIALILFTLVLPTDNK